MRSQKHQHEGQRPTGRNPFTWAHYHFTRGFEKLRETYRDALAWCVAMPWLTAAFFGILIVASLALFPLLGRDFFPNVDAGEMRLHVRAPAGSRIEVTAQYFARVEKAVREIVGDHQINSVLDNIGLPYSGMNMAIGDTATVGTMDGEILVSLNQDHTTTAAHMADLRRELPRRFPDCQFFLPGCRHREPGVELRVSPRRLTSRVVGSDPVKTYALAQKTGKRSRWCCRCGGLTRFPGSRHTGPAFRYQSQPRSAGGNESAAGGRKSAGHPQQ